MAKRKHRQRRDGGAIRPVLRPVTWSALLGAAISGAVGAPAQADPPVTTYAEPNVPARVPDDGVRPQPAGPVQLPGATTPTNPLFPITPVTSGLGPLALQITALETEVAGLGEQLKQVSIERQQITAELAALTAAWRQATADLHEAETAAESAAERAYRRAAELPPGAVDSDLHGLGALSPLQREEADGSAAQATQLKVAREAEQAAYLAKADAESRLRNTDARFTTLQAAYKQRERALLELRQRNASQLAAVEREREAQEQRLGASYVNGSVNGLTAHPDALKAMRFALAQLGEPYLWGAEGPSRWDCSGLTWAAYKSAGHSIPRVSRDQYQATKGQRVSPNALLPGDLLFFSSSPTDASKIHHVGMYIGGGKMVNAPSAGDVVKIATVWWSRFFAATRVVGAVPAPPSTPPPPPPTTPGPKPTKTKSPTPKPTKTTPAPGPTTPTAGPTTPTAGPTTPTAEPTTNPPQPLPEPTPKPPAATTPAATEQTSSGSQTPTGES